MLNTKYFITTSSKLFHPGAIVLVIVLAVVLPAVAVGEKNGRVYPVEVFKAITQDIVYMEETTGSFYAEADVDIRSEVDGIVKEILFEEGSKVKKGKLLITIGDERYRFKEEEHKGRVREAEADLVLARKTLKRIKQLYEEGVVSGQEYDEAVSGVELKEANLKATRAALSLAEDELGDTRIYAPISGTVSKKFIDVGEYVSEGNTDLLNIVDINPIKLEFTVPAKYYSYVKTGQEVSVSVEAYPGEEFVGTVYYINPKTVVETRRFQCYAKIPNPDDRLIPGFFVLVKLPVALHPDAVVVLEEALLSEEGIRYCFVVEDGRAVKVVVTPGIRLKGGMVEILKGLKAGDSVVVRGQYVLSAGDSVEPKPFKANEGA